MSKEKPIVLFKYGGSAMVDNNLKKHVLQNIAKLKENGYDVVIVHGGGPYIKKILTDVSIESEFIDGHRKTTEQAFDYVEMALKGDVNSKLVSGINSLGYQAVGLSGRDGQTVLATKRYHQQIQNGKPINVDLGQVGNVKEVNTDYLEVLLNNDYIPVIACLAADETGMGYNINGDMFAGHIAGALQVEQYVVLTNVDGLLIDKDDATTLIANVHLSEIKSLMNKNIIQGGMIPKIESCEIAIQKGAQSARIINGTKADQILAIANHETIGTLIKK